MFDLVQDLEIRVDHREKRCAVPEILEKSHGFKVVFETLDCGDYLVPGLYRAERKRADDFSVSVIDGRLFAQAARLRRSPEFPVVLIEGDIFSLCHGISRSAAAGALAEISGGMGLSVVHVPDDEIAAAFLFALCFAGLPDRRPKVRSALRRKRPDDPRLAVLCSFPGVGFDRAKRMLEKFGSLSAVFGASIKDLRSVNGIGKTIASHFRDILCAGGHEKTQ